MKNTIIKIGLSLSLIVFLCGSILAEVSAEVDASGKYLKMIYIEKATGKSVKVWTVFWIKSTYYPLNPYGDLNKDLKPAMRENIYDGNQPYVVWPRFDGNDYEIAYSKWTNTGWRPIAYVEDMDNLSDDLDPAITFDIHGRAYMAWWRDEQPYGKVYVSVFLNTKWMDAYPISDEGVDSWDPDIKFNEKGQIQITFTTPSGQETKCIVFHFPETITDDIDPFGTGLVETEEEQGDSSYGQ